MNVYVGNHFMLEIFQIEPGIVCITKSLVGFLCFFFFSFFYYSGFLCNFNVPEQTLKMSGISE